MFTDYEASGWKLCAIERGKKAPTIQGWSTTPFPAESIEALEQGAGLLHALSGTCALDIDNIELARPWLAERGVDLDALMDESSAVMISSGRPGRAKLLYKLSRPLRTLKPKASGVELRCAAANGNSVQDVLPPTIHPDTKKPYVWKYGDELIAHWSNLPTIPAQLARLWKDELHDSPPHEVGDEHPHGAHPKELIRKAIFQHIERHAIDVSEYEEWLKIGMRLHDETGGAADGLEIWDEWSRTDQSRKPDGSKRYEVYDSLKRKWMTFGESGGRSVTMKGIFREMPAERDDFADIEPEAPGEETTEQTMEKSATEKRKEALAELEKRVIYVRSAERYFDTETHRLIQTDSALQNLFMPLMPRAKGGGRVDPVKALKQSQSKQVVAHLGFDPGAGSLFTDAHGDRFANVYRNRMPPAEEPTTEEREIIEFLFDRIGDPVIRDYYMQFLAHVVQYPGEKIRSAPLIWSDTQGNGKSTLVQRIPALIVGTDYSAELTGNQLADTFTGYLMNLWHITLKEFRAGSRGEREAISKKVEAWISDDTVAVRQMYQTAFTMPNRFFVTASSNKDDAASIDNNDRKWAIAEMKGAKLTRDELKWIFKFLGKRKDGADPILAGAKLRGYFGAIDLSAFNPDDSAPFTKDKAAMIATNLSSDLEWLVAAVEERLPPFDREIVITREATQAVHKNCTARPSADRVGKILTHAPFNGVPLLFRAGESRYRAIALRNSDHWRAAPGRQIMAHIQGEDADVSQPDPLLE